MKEKLTEEKKQELEDLHAHSHDKRFCDCIKAVLLRSEGWNTAMISQALRIHETSVLRHLKDYEQSEKLKPENGGSKSNLSDTQTTELIEHLTEHTYHQTNQIVAFVLEHFDIKYSVAGMNKWLHHNGFSYKKPKGIPHKFDEIKQAEFIAYYEKLKADCGEDETILFIDAVHPTQATKISYGWIKTGEEKAIETTGSRTRLNLIGAVNLLNIKSTVVNDYETINSENIVDFFRKLKANYPANHKLHIILDGAGYHRSDLVKNSAKELGITLHYLPPYSPNLNPIERLWKVMNEKSRNNVYFKSKQHFIKAINNFFSKTLPEISESLVSRINDNFQVLKQASST